MRYRNPAISGVNDQRAQDEVDEAVRGSGRFLPRAEKGENLAVTAIVRILHARP
jgi:hypothetical protein